MTKEESPKKPLNVRDSNYYQQVFLYSHPAFAPILVLLFNGSRRTIENIGAETGVPHDQLEARLVWLEAAGFVRHSLHYRSHQTLWSLTKTPKLIFNQVRWRISTWMASGYRIPELPTDEELVDPVWIEAQRAALQTSQESDD